MNQQLRLLAVNDMFRVIMKMNGLFGGRPCLITCRIDNSFIIPPPAPPTPSEFLEGNKDVEKTEPRVLLYSSVAPGESRGGGVWGGGCHSQLRRA